MYNTHCTRLAGRLGIRRMYDSLCKEIYWPHLPMDVHHTVSIYQSCKRHQLDEKHPRLPKLFPPSGPLEPIALDILGPLIWIKQRNRSTMVMTDRFTKLTRVIIVMKVTALCVVAVVLEN